MDFESIVDAILANQVRISDHADEEATADGLSFDEICFSAIHGEIIEDYPAYKPLPSCLALGNTSGGVPVHSVWAYNAEIAWAALITVYRPDPEQWINGRERKKP